MKRNNKTKDSPSLIVGLLGFLNCLLGLILYLLFKGPAPRRARSALIGAFINLIITLAIILFL